jgi:hypothetical protein
MPYTVIHYSHPTILVGHSRTKARHIFFIGEDGSLEQDDRTGLGSARRAAIEFLSKREGKGEPSSGASKL